MRVAVALLALAVGFCLYANSSYDGEGQNTSSLERQIERESRVCEEEEEEEEEEGTNGDLLSPLIPRDLPPVNEPDIHYARYLDDPEHWKKTLRICIAFKPAIETMIEDMKGVTWYESPEGPLGYTWDAIWAREQVECKHNRTRYMSFGRGVITALSGHVPQCWFSFGHPFYEGKDLSIVKFMHEDGDLFAGLQSNFNATAQVSPLVSEEVIDFLSEFVEPKNEAEFRAEMQISFLIDPQPFRHIEACLFNKKTDSLACRHKACVISHVPYDETPLVAFSMGFVCAVDPLAFRQVRQVALSHGYHSSEYFESALAAFARVRHLLPPLASNTNEGACPIPNLP